MSWYAAPGTKKSPAGFPAGRSHPPMPRSATGAHPGAASLPLHHQQVSQTRMAKGLDCDRHGSIPSLLPSTAQSIYWHGRWRDLPGDDSDDTIINR